MAKAAWFEGSTKAWAIKTEKTSDGWLIRVNNQAPFPTGFFIHRFDFKLEKDKRHLVEGATMLLISESVANPGEEVVLNLTVKSECIPSLSGTPLKILYGSGAGQYCDTAESVLP